MTMARIQCLTDPCVGPDDTSTTSANCIRCGKVVNWIDGLGWIRRPDQQSNAPTIPKPSVEFVWLSISGKVSPAKWYREADGGVVGDARPPCQPLHVPIARHRLSIDEERLSIAELTQIYPAPGREPT